MKNLQCKTLIFVGDSSEFLAESVYMSAKMGRKNCALVEVVCSFSMLYLALALNYGNPITFMYSLKWEGQHHSHKKKREGKKMTPRTLDQLPLLFKCKFNVDYLHLFAFAASDFGSASQTKMLIF